MIAIRFTRGWHSYEISSADDGSVSFVGRRDGRVIGYADDPAKLVALLIRSTARKAPEPQVGVNTRRTNPL